jgi:superfamily II DNA or RNA helicase
VCAERPGRGREGHDVGGLTYGGRVAANPWIPESEIEAFVGSAALGRARAYANPGRIRDLALGPGGHTVSAWVEGSAAEWYSTTVTLTDPAPNRSVRPTFSSCTCPVRMRCKHAAAVMLLLEAAATADEAPGWRRLAEGAVDALTGHRPRRESPVVGLQLTVVPDEQVHDGWSGGPRPGLGNRLRARIVVPARGGRWRSAGLEWDRLRYGYTGDLSPAQVSWLRAVDVLARSRRQARVWLDLCDAEVPALWPLFAAAAEAEIEIVPGETLDEVRSGPPRRLGLTAWSPDGREVVVSAAAEVVPGEDGGPDDDGRGRPLPGALVGESGDLVAVVSGRVLELSPVGRLDPGTVRRLRGWRELTIPDEDVPEFCGDYLPALAESYSVADRAGRLELPEFDRVELGLTIRSVSGPAGYGARFGGAGPDLLLEWSRVVVLRLSDGTETERRFALRGSDSAGVESDLVAALDRVAQSEWVWALSADPVRVNGLEAALLLVDGVPALRAMEGVRVAVFDGVPEVRRATEEPRVHVAAHEEDRSGIDWLGLSVRVTVEGEAVPFAELFRAVVTGQEEFVTSGGVLVAVDLERFGELRELLEEALQATVERLGTLPDDDGDLRIGLGQAGLFADLAELADDLAPPTGRARALLDLASDTPAPVPVPAALDADLRPYQKEGLDWLALLWRHRIGGILADDMGLGKTVQSLALIAHALETAEAEGELPGPFLVVAPSSVVPNWEAEARRFVPSLRVSRRAVTETKASSTVADDAAGHDIVLTSAAVLRLDAAAYAGVGWAGVILDEAQQAKNPSSKLFAALAGLRADFLLAVTGTPMENNLTELWAVTTLACRGLLPDAREFRTLFRTPIEKHGDAEALRRLRRRLRPFLLRRRKELVAGELPPRTDAVVEVELSAAHRRVYERELARQRAALLKLLDDFDANRITILAGLTVLRRLCLDPAIVDDAHATIASAKTEELLASLREVVAEGHRALVFSQFTTYLDTVVDRLRDEGITVAHLDGSTLDRAGAVGEFTKGGAQVFCLSLKAGGVGLNLVGADYVFLLDPWWNPATEAQAVDRAHRIGQTRPVMVYRMVARDTIEERVVELQRRKAELFASVLDSGVHFSAALTAEDLRGLLE